MTEAHEKQQCIYHLEVFGSHLFGSRRPESVLSRYEALVRKGDVPGLYYTKGESKERHEITPEELRQAA